MNVRHSRHCVGILLAALLVLPAGASAAVADERDTLLHLAAAGPPTSASGQFTLGIAYDEGRGVSQDHAEAVRWYRLAAAQGHPIAQNNLGLKYERGEGVEQDYVQAYMWFEIAAASDDAEGREEAARNRDKLTAKMTAEQIAEAERLARDWRQGAGQR